MAGEQHPEWLPVNWKVDEKKSLGRKRKCYTDPKNGFKFYSKPRVLRYLNGEVNTQQKQSKVKRRKVTIERIVAEKLPQGWVKEIRTKRVSGKMRKDAYYIEPVTGREFSSMAAVFRYLKANDSGKVESEADGEDHIRAKLEDHSQSSRTEAEGQSLIENKEDAEFREQKIAESEDGMENLIQQNELMTLPLNDLVCNEDEKNEKQPEVSVEAYLTEPGIDLSVKSPKEEIQMNKSGVVPAAGSSSVLPESEFFNIPWFSPAYNLLNGEISVEMYILLTYGTHHGVEGRSNCV